MLPDNVGFLSVVAQIVTKLAKHIKLAYQCLNPIFWTDLFKIIRTFSLSSWVNNEKASSGFVKGITSDGLLFLFFKGVPSTKSPISAIGSLKIDRQKAPQIREKP